MSVIVDRFLKDIGVSMQYEDIGDMRLKLQLYDRCFDTKYKTQYDDFAYKIASKYKGNAEAYLAEYTRVKEAAMEEIKSRREYARFLETDIIADEAYRDNDNQKTVYTSTNDNKVFISIDMRKANFSSLRCFGVFNEDTWEEFLSKFTDDEHILNSKYIRQVILGNCSPKRQMQLETKIMSLLYERLMLKDSIVSRLAAASAVRVAAKAVDEIVLQITDPSVVIGVANAIEDIVADVESQAGRPLFRVQVYKLYALTEQILLSNNASVQRVSKDNAKTLGYIRQFIIDGKRTAQWDCKCLDNVRLYLLLAQYLDMQPFPSLFFVDTSYGLTELKAITMPDFNWDKIKAFGEQEKTSIFS